MLEVVAKYVNTPHTMKNTKTDYFVYLDVEVKGHAEHTGYVNNTRVCAGVSAVTLGISRLISDDDFHIEHRHGYYHIWTNNCLSNLKWLDKESVYAINTMVCQLYEIYCNYPNAFSRFDLIDVKELLENEERKSNTYGEQPTKPKPNIRRRMGLHSIIQKVNLEEN